MLQNIFHNSTNCQNTTDSYNTYNANVSNNYTVTDDRPQLLAWLSPLDPGLRHCDIQERRVDHVGEWLMGTKEFRRWCRLDGETEGDKEVIFCYGHPGVGKTFISSLVVDRMCDQTRGQNAAVTCFYFDFAARKEQTATSMLGSLLKQMVSGTGRMSEDIWRGLREQREAVSGRRPQLGDIVKMLQLIISSQRTFMVIDALDECTAVQRYRLFDSLKVILEKSPDTRIFVTGRPHIRAEIEIRLTRRVTSVSVGPTRDDIVRFLRFRLSEDETPEAMDESLEADILEKIPGNISEMFLLASLNIEGILKESTMYRRRERLNKMTNGLGLEDVYGATIEQINAQGGDKARLGMGALMWICHAERPLSADELCHALAVELGSTDFNANNVPSMSTLVSCCQGLITADKETSTMRLTHFTLREYLSTSPDIFNRPHSAIAEICLTYLNSKQVKAIPANRSPDLSNTPFLEYGSLYWGVHAKRDLSDNASSLALELFQECDGHISIRILIDQEEYEYLNVEEVENSFLFTGLHCASFFGIVELAAALLEMECYDINGGDFGGTSPLAWAACNGHEGVVKFLLGREEVNPDKPDNDDWTPLFYAAWRGHQGVVKMLLGRHDVNLDKASNYCETPLLLAAKHGHEGVVKILLAREEVNPDKPDSDSRTPLSYAAWDNHEGVVKILLGREEVNPDMPDNDGKTPLLYAAENGHEGVVKILLGREEVNPDNPDNDGRTPLWYAAFNGHEGVVKILLQQEEVNPDKPDSGGKTPLGLATRYGYKRVMELLKAHEAATPRAT